MSPSVNHKKHDIQCSATCPTFVLCSNGERHHETSCVYLACPWICQQIGKSYETLYVHFSVAGMYLTCIVCMCLLCRLSSSWRDTTGQRHHVPPFSSYRVYTGYCTWCLMVAIVKNIIKILYNGNSRIYMRNMRLDMWIGASAWPTLMYILKN